MIKTEGLAPEWEASWNPNEQGVMELSDARTDNDLTLVSSGPHLAHLHPNTSQRYLIKYNYKLAGEKVNRTGIAELQPKVPVVGVDLEQAREWDKSFPNQWNSVIKKNNMVL
jgi:hypothetical protein